METIHMNNDPYFLAFNRIPQIGPRKVAKFLSIWPNLEDMFQLSAQSLEESGVSAPYAKAIANFDMRLIEADWRWAQKPFHHLLTLNSPLYPPILKEIYDAPLILYARGDLQALQGPALAMVGTRKPSIAGLENAKHFAKSLAEAGITIVSGLALGIDAEAHKGCLEALGRTIAVMGTGIDCIYPQRHRSLAARIIEKGLLLSEFPLQSPPIAGHFPRRNRIISGLSLITLVVEAAIRSGSLITARFALEQNRDVLALPGSIHNPQARGCHFLLQQGAKLVTSVADVLDELQLDRVKKKEMPITFSEVRQEDGLLQYLGYEVTSIDTIMARSHLDMETVTGGLLQLELQGCIQTVPGGYIRCEYER
jgi:DNA processing protein